MFTKAPARPAFAGSAAPGVPAQLKHEDAGIYAPAAPGAANAATQLPPGSTIVELSQPLVTHKGDVRQIVLKPITVGDFIDCGAIETVRVLSLDEAGQPKEMEHRINNEALIEWATRLTGLDRLIISSMTADGPKLLRAVRLAVAKFEAGN